MKLIPILIIGCAIAAQAGNYGSAGCGLGSIVMGKSGNQVLAATTNGTSGSQLFGITTGTSNCTDDGVAMKEREKEAFTEANFESLRQEMAQGQGENLYALADLMGCDAVGAKALSGEIKNNYGAVVSDSPAALLANLETLQASTGLCQE